MLTSRKDVLDYAHKTYEAILSKAATRYFNPPIYTQVDRAGVTCTMLEELFRPLWGLAPVLKEKEIILTCNAQRMTAPQFYKTVMLQGTSNTHENRFDKNVSEYNKEFFANQSITEIAAYLTCVSFAKEEFWDILTGQEQQQIMAWIYQWAQYALAHSWPNNHYWYPIICIMILKNLGFDVHETEDAVSDGLAILDSLYIDNGWYSDGEFGRFDYYEAWAHHCYTLLYPFIGDKTRPDFDARCAVYKARSEQFLAFFAHYFDCDGGMAAYGRSINYRFAAISGYGLAAAAGCNINLGMAKRLVLRNINYFVENAITEDGTLPNGYLYNAYSFLECYSSEGSSYCYTEGFLCLLAPEDSAFWQAEEAPLPIEQGNYAVQLPLDGVGAVIVGNQTNGVTVFNNSIHYYQEPFFTKRFNDMAGYYGKFAYNARAGYSISTVDQVSAENMISLYTPDGRMASHRQEIHMLSTTPEQMLSWHRPFSNDPDTTIVTCLRPLPNGYHIRFHKVVLSQPYLVLEGGFSVGVAHDGFSAGNGKVVYENNTSTIDVVSDVTCTLGCEATHPGCHTLKPRAIYPCYQTAVLQPGTYYFASCVYFATDNIVRTPPTMDLTTDALTITYSDKTCCIAKSVLEQPK